MKSFCNLTLAVLSLAAFPVSASAAGGSAIGEVPVHLHTILIGKQTDGTLWAQLGGRWNLAAQVAEENLSDPVEDIARSLLKHNSFKVIEIPPRDLQDLLNRYDALVNDMGDKYTKVLDENRTGEVEGVTGAQLAGVVEYQLSGVAARSILDPSTTSTQVETSVNATQTMVMTAMPSLGSMGPFGCLLGCFNSYTSCLDNAQNGGEIAQCIASYLDCTYGCINDAHDDWAH